MASPGIERCFSMAAFIAFVELRAYRMDHPALSLPEAVRSVKELKSAASGLDFIAGLTLLDRLDAGLDWKPSKDGLRLFVFEWVRLTEPLWLRFVPYGREKLRQALSDDEAQCFREAGLFDDQPDEEAIRWWDRIAALMRGAAEREKMLRSRLAERLSLEHERKRLQHLGIDREPRWVSLEDNSLGYDILSYDMAGGLVVNRLIEVKSTLSDTIFLTRNEWNNASSSPERTVFHVWRLPAKEFREYKVAEIEPNIPLDRGSGVWGEARVTLCT